MKPSHGPAFKVKSLNGNMCHYMHKILKKTSHGPNKNNSANIMPSRENAQNACHCTKVHSSDLFAEIFFLEYYCVEWSRGEMPKSREPCVLGPVGACTLYNVHTRTDWK